MAKRGVAMRVYRVYALDDDGLDQGVGGPERPIVLRLDELGEIDGHFP